MARGENDENIPYLKAATAPTEDDVLSKDDEDYRTLIEAQKILNDGIEGLSKDFNAFDLSKDAKINTEAQIAGRQIAYDLLVPVKSLIDSAIEAVENNRKVA